MTQPWLPYMATEYIRYLNPKRVFEWGSGESTLFFLQLCRNVVSIEHNQEWYDQVKPVLWRDKWNIDYRLIPYEPGTIGPDKANPAHYKSGSTELGDVNFKNYVTAIDEFDAFDLILIDGMARASCLVHAVKHLTYGGVIVLDNADRSYYLEQTAHLFGNYEDGWERVEFMGYGPILAYQWKTLFLINRRKGYYV